MNKLQFVLLSNCSLLTIVTRKFAKFQKPPPRGVLKKRCSKNMQQMYRRTPIPNIFRTPFPKNALGGCFWNLLLFIFFIFRHSCNGWNEWSREILFRSSYCRCSITKAVLKNFAIFKGKHLCCILNCVELNLVF